MNRERQLSEEQVREAFVSDPDTHAALLSFALAYQNYGLDAGSAGVLAERLWVILGQLERVTIAREEEQHAEDYS